MGFELVGVEFVRAGKHSTLRVYIDHPERHQRRRLRRCQSPGQLSAILDVEDPISTEYYLEVSSPGADRRLFKPEHYQAFAIGEKSLVTTQHPRIDGRRNFTGQIVQSS